MTTPRGAPELVASQAIPETTVNEQVRHTEAGAGHFMIVDRDLTAPPGTCADGASYIIAGTATGLWAGKEDQIATALGTNAASGWTYHTPIEGFTGYVQDENLRVLFDGTNWVNDTTGGSGDLLSSNNLSDLTDQAEARTNIGADVYIIGAFATTAPTASEVLQIHIVTDPFDFPANFASPNSRGAVGTNPASSFVLDVQRQINATGAFSSIGTITISTGGAFTFATTSGTAKSIAANDVIKVVAPATPDASIADLTVSLRGSRT